MMSEVQKSPSGEVTSTLRLEIFRGQNAPPSLLALEGDIDVKNVGPSSRDHNPLC